MSVNAPNKRAVDLRQQLQANFAFFFSFSISPDKTEYFVLSILVLEIKIVKYNKESVEFL